MKWGNDQNAVSMKGVLTSLVGDVCVYKEWQHVLRADGVPFRVCSVINSVGME